MRLHFFAQPKRHLPLSFFKLASFKITDFCFDGQCVLLQYPASESHKISCKDTRGNPNMTKQLSMYRGIWLQAGKQEENDFNVCFPP